MPRRSKIQIITKILEICLQSSAGKTKIVYQTNMNFYSVVPYLDLMTGKGLLEIVPGRRQRYKTTPKGKRALMKLRVIKEKITEEMY